MNAYGWEILQADNRRLAGDVSEAIRIYETISHPSSIQVPLPPGSARAFCWHHALAADAGAATADMEWLRAVADTLETLCKTSYYARDWRGRFGYRLFRNPLVMFGIGPVYSLMIAPRLTSFDKRARLRNSVLLTNVAIAGAITAICLLLGWKQFMLIELPAAFLAAAAGVWLFYVQHQFEDVYWETGDRWSYAEAALRGSSYLKLPQPLQFFTGNIGLHHVHHLNARVPNYNLQRAHDENEVFRQVPVLTIRKALRSSRLKLWDPASKRLLTFSEAKATHRRNAVAARPAPSVT